MWWIIIPPTMCIHLTMDHDSTQLNAPPRMGNMEYSLTRTSPGRQGWHVDSVHAIFIHLTYNTLLSQLAMGCVTCHTCHGCVTDFRPILGNPVEVTHVTSPGHVYIFPH